MNSIWLPISAVFVAVMLTFGVFSFFRFVVRLDEDGKLVIFILRVIQTLCVGFIIFSGIYRILGGEF